MGKRACLVFAAAALALGALAGCGVEEERVTEQAPTQDSTPALQTPTAVVAVPATPITPPPIIPTAVPTASPEPVGSATPMPSSTATPATAVPAPMETPISVAAPSEDATVTVPILVPVVERVVFAQPAPSAEGWDPNFDFGPPDDVQTRPMYEHLVEVDPVTGAFQPALATAWSFEPGGLGIRFQLREGVQFHGDWGEFTAKDVVHTNWSISREGSGNNASVYFRSIVKEVEAVNNYEVVIRMTQSDTDFPRAIAPLQGAFALTSKANYDEVGQPALTGPPSAGTGPYMPVERAPGEYIIYEEAPHEHWRGPVDFPEMEIRWVDDDLVRLASLLAGEVHIAPIAPGEERAAVEQGMVMVQGSAPDTRIYLDFMGSWWNTHGDPSSGRKHSHSPLLDRNVRAAMSKALDRDAINEFIFEFAGDNAVSGHFHPSRPGWNDDWAERFPEEYSYDPEGARGLLAASGYSPSHQPQVDLYYGALPAYPWGNDLIEVAGAFFLDVGVRVSFVVMDETERNDLALAHEFDNRVNLVVTSTTLLEAGRLHMTSLDPVAGNHQDAHINAAYNAAAAALSPEDQDEAFRALGDLVFEEYAHIPLFWLPTWVAVNPDIVSSYTFAGNASGSWGSFYSIGAVEKEQ
ncbi:MAG: ABC transporter substrate-binding protein [Chloroflexi bacterium]|nr:ABC transporter substrate-binding protein [Chloroflexota bacterium]